jgi:hypothetical protein
MSVFPSMTQPRYPSSAIGIEADVLSAVSLKGLGRGQYTIRQAASLDLPPGLVSPSFLDINIVDDVAFISCLREVVESAGLMNQKRWSVALPGNTARTSILTLETTPASAAETEEMLDWKAEQNFGVPAAELRVSRQKISPDREGRARFFATAVKLTVIDEYETIFESLGWRAGLILPRTVGEAHWLMGGSEAAADSLLISGSVDGFTGLLLRGSEPAVIRSVNCAPEEIDDEIYRLVMYYHDRIGGAGLDRLLVVGKDLVPENVRSIASEALGEEIRSVAAEDLGLQLPGEIRFDDIAAPAGLAAIGA